MTVKFAFDDLDKVTLQILEQALSPAEFRSFCKGVAFGKILTESLDSGTKDLSQSAEYLNLVGRFDSARWNSSPDSD